MKEEVIVSGHGKEWVSTLYQFDNGILEVDYITTKKVKSMIVLNAVGIQVRYLAIADI